MQGGNNEECGEMDQFHLGFLHSLQLHIDPGSG